MKMMAGFTICGAKTSRCSGQKVGPIARDGHPHERHGRERRGAKTMAELAVDHEGQNTDSDGHRNEQTRQGAATLAGHGQWLILWENSDCQCGGWQQAFSLPATG